MTRLTYGACWHVGHVSAIALLHISLTTATTTETTILTLLEYGAYVRASEDLQGVFADVATDLKAGAWKSDVDMTVARVSVSPETEDFFVFAYFVLLLVYNVYWYFHVRARQRVRDARYRHMLEKHELRAYLSTYSTTQPLSEGARRARRDMI
jgi:hypothetical protein